MAFSLWMSTRKCEIRIKGMDYERHETARNRIRGMNYEKYETARNRIRSMNYEKYEMTRNRFKRTGDQRYEGRERVSLVRLPDVRIPVLDDGRVWRAGRVPRLLHSRRRFFPSFLSRHFAGFVVYQAHRTDELRLVQFIYHSDNVSSSMPTISLLIPFVSFRDFRS